MFGARLDGASGLGACAMLLAFGESRWLVGADSVWRWTDQYGHGGLSGFNKNPRWGVVDGHRRLTSEQVARHATLVGGEAVPGTEVGSGWTLYAFVDLVQERSIAPYSQRAMRKFLRATCWSWQRGRALNVTRTPEDHVRFEVESQEVLVEFAASGEKMKSSAGHETRVYLERRASGFNAALRVP